jgi:hypothetical protein
MERTSVPCVRVLATGQRVRVRMPRGSDRGGLEELAARQPGAPDAARLLRFDPRRRSVLVAAAWVGARLVVGYAAADRGCEDEPDVLLVDEELAPGVGAILREVLAAEAAARERYAA